MGCGEGGSGAVILLYQKLSRLSELDAGEGDDSTRTREIEGVAKSLG